MDFDRGGSLNASTLLRPYGRAEHALGRLGHALETTSLHATWLWREVIRASVAIVQASGHQAKVEPLQRLLIGAPISAYDNTSGVAAAKRVFLTAAPMFHVGNKADSDDVLWPQFWQSESSSASNRDEASRPDGDGRAGVGDRQRAELVTLVHELAGFADDGRMPALINLFIDLRRHAAGRRLPAHLMRLGLPLALVRAGVVPKSAPGLLGGRRLPLGMSRARAELMPLTDWLARGLGDLAEEADQSYRRLAELTRQHRAWHGALANEGLRKHARAPRALDLLAATPVLSIGLVARHLGCTHVAAGKIVERLVALGILIDQTSRSRHKVFVAGDLSAPSLGENEHDQPMISSEPVPLADIDALGATLKGLFADLDRLNERAMTRLHSN